MLACEKMSLADRDGKLPQRICMPGLHFQEIVTFEQEGLHSQPPRDQQLNVALQERTRKKSTFLAQNPLNPKPQTPKPSTPKILHPKPEPPAP